MAVGDKKITGNSGLALGKINTHVPSDDCQEDLVLVVDDSRLIQRLLSTQIDQLPDIQAVVADSLAYSKATLEKNAHRFYLAIVGLNLPDAPHGEIVDLVHSFDIPVIVLTASVNETIRQQILKKNVVDYVIKQQMSEIEHVIYLAGRIHQNGQVKVLIVDDSKSFRMHLEQLVGRYNYQTLTATDGQEALDIIEDTPDISLVLTDYNMPNVDGMALIRKIREQYSREEMAIIGMSDTSNPALSAQFLKAGANDFITKPFQVEEFFCRVTQNTNTICYVRQIKDSATRDFLTKAFNRRHLYELGESLFENAKRGNIRLAAALIDADHFKSINDNWGHHIGDRALIALAQTMAKTMRSSDIVARFGGEEFVVLALMENKENAVPVFEKLRQAIEDIELVIDDTRIPLTVSIGVTTQLGDNLDAMLQFADEGVYKAKEAGRNCVQEV